MEMYNMLVGISSEIEKIKLELVDSEFYLGGRAGEVQIKINIFLGNLHCHSKTASNERIEFTYNNLIQHVSF